MSTLPAVTDIEGGALPPRWLAGVGGILLVSILLLTWLFMRADAVSPQKHYDYVHLLRDLRESDAVVNAELLASRLELTRNYDALTEQTNHILTTNSAVAQVPAFIDTTARIRVEAAARTLKTAFETKAGLIEAFKRENAVARNSLAIFPVIAGDMIEHWNGATSRPLERYVRRVLVFSRSPTADQLGPVQSARKSLDAMPATEQERAMIDVLLQHGDTLVRTLPKVNQLTRQALALDTTGQIERLNNEYEIGHAEAVLQAERYRALLFGLAVLVTGYLALTFVRLHRTQRSLADANREISARYAAQIQAESQLRLHATAFRNAHEGMTLTDADGNILDVNPAFTRITGFERDEVIGRNPRILKSGRHDAEFYAEMWDSIKAKGSWHGEIWNRNKFGEIYPELLSISAVNGPDGNRSNFVAVFADISRLKAQENQLTLMAYHDALTGLPNRALLADRMNQAMSHARRGSGHLVAVCYLDLDGFKEVNDTLGHKAGDQVLIEMSRRLRDSLRGGDTLARLGGDEFVLLLGLDGLGECERSLQRLIQLINQPLTVASNQVKLTASIGVTLFPDDDGDPDTLLRHADLAMYLAKQQGKNRYFMFDPDQDRATRHRRDSRLRLQQALDDGEFVLHYQPLVDLRAGRLVGVEALIRWQHPEQGLVAPVEFLPLVENDPLIVRIGNWVIETALAQLERWHAEGLAIALSVNVAGRQLQHPSFIQDLRAALDRHPSVKDWLELEVLETTALEEVAVVSRVIEECQALGVQVSLDDFGTGYSSLTYLVRLPVTRIKIDRSFVQAMLNDRHNLVIVQGILGLASAFQRQVVAEGVETIEQGRLLMQMNCSVVQGYSIAQPMPAERLVQWATDWRPPPEYEAIRDRYWEVDDYPMFIAEVEHRNWIGQLIYAVREGQPAPREQLAQHDQCRFGKWYYGRGRLKYRDVPGFAEVEEPHRQVHVLVNEIDHHWRTGQPEQARALLGQLIERHAQVLDAMKALEITVASGHAPAAAMDVPGSRH